ncbi:MAG TPA: CocE/NonD family hydrolase [Nevskiaceae bacterium]|nr:CocE/NonD family hydrolase [Nevskiaceae bacterium]
MRRRLPQGLTVLALALAVPHAVAQPPGYQLPPPPVVLPEEVRGFEFHAPSAAADPSAGETMRDLAARMVPVYEEKRTELYQSNLSALQLVARTFVPAADSRRLLAERRGDVPGWPMDRAVLLDLYATAKEREAGGGITFPTAFRQVFSETVPTLDDRTAEALSELMARPVDEWRREVQHAFDTLKARSTIEMKQALELVWLYLWFDAARDLAIVAPSLDVDEYRRRYVVGEDVVVRTRGNAEVVARFVRPNSGDRKLPTLLQYTLYTSDADARAAAAHGYVGVVAHPRMREGVKGRLTPFEHDGDDARAVIEWIVQQPWSDGRVGMLGSGYGGFAAWAVAKKPPAALAAIVTSDATAPGIDFPMENGVFRNEAYRWAAEQTQGIPDPVLVDDPAWQALDLAWYFSGRPYRDLDRISKKPNRVFRRWLGHPSYDRYWQKMIPFGKEFAQVGVPVLSTTGTYADGAVGALYYFREHLRHRPDADHRLLVGPWGPLGLRDPVARAPDGPPLDTAARLDLREVRFGWLDHVFKGRPLPALLAQRVTVQVPGANRWRQADTLEALAHPPTRFYLEPRSDAERLRLVAEAPPADAFLEQVVKLADRSDADRPPLGPIVSRNLAIPYGLTFVSEPLDAPVTIVGPVSGLLDFRPSRMDVDLNVSVYEALPNGDYVRLSAADEYRASYLRDRVHRRLLKAGVRQSIPFQGAQVASRRLQAGSRIVVVIGVNKRPDREINYGTGKDVSVETKRDGRKPLKIRWYGGSHVELPIAR